MLGQILGNYRIVAMLGSGAMGRVFLAEHQRIARRVAIKVLNQDLTTNPVHVARFLDEARATSLIRHPGIVEVFDCDVDQMGRVYLVMEYLEGRTLAERLEDEGRLPWPIACALARQVAVALGAAHDQGIIHRDIKPENVFLADTPDGATGDGPVVKILDFGIAKLLSEDAGGAHLTIPGALLGTPHYMPPEQCGATERIDRRADIYALGCMLFRMISGRLPFAGSRVQDVIAAHASRPAPPLGAVNPAPPPWLEALVARMMAKQPSGRPASMDEVARVLDPTSSGWNATGGSIQGGRSFVSRLTARLSLGGTFQFHGRRISRWPVALIAVCCGMLVAGGVWGAGSILWRGKTLASAPRTAAPEPTPVSSPVVQPPPSPAAANRPAPLADLPASEGAVEPTRAPVPTRTRVEDGPLRTHAPPPAAAASVRSRVSQSRATTRIPPTRRSAPPIVEMDGLVDL